MKNLLIVLAAALALSVPAFASDLYFSDSLVVSSGNSTYTYTSTDPEKPVYFFLQNFSTGVTDIQINMISEFRNAYCSVSTNGGNPVSNAYTSVSAVSGETTYYIHNNYLNYYNTNAAFTPSLAVFSGSDSYDDIAAAFDTFLNSPQTPAIPSTFTVPCGNVLYFKVDREQDVTFTAVMPVLSSLLGTPTGAWNSGIQFGLAAALPSSGTTFPILSQDPINFAKTVSNQNLLGQTKNAISTKHCIAGQYYALYLPYHYGGWLALGSSHVYPDGSTSGGIVGANVTVSGSFAEIKVYPLTEKANGDLLTGSVTLDSGSDDGFASYFDGEISETGTVTWLDQNGDISSPSVGGTSYVPEDVSTESIIDQIKNILSSIVSEIKNLFSFGYEAVKTLVGLMRDFVSIFQQLYEWLPSEVYSALISAIIVAITIGVFKVFL